MGFPGRCHSSNLKYELTNDRNFSTPIIQSDAQRSTASGPLDAYLETRRVEMRLGRDGCDGGMEEFSGPMPWGGYDYTSVKSVIGLNSPGWEKYFAVDRW